MKIQLPSYSTSLFKPFRYKVLYGGRGSAKSHTIARSLLIKASQAPFRILCTREHQTSIKDSVHKLLKDIINEHSLPGFTITDTAIRHENGSEFIFKGLRLSIDDIKSTEGIDICWVEEAQVVSQKSLDILIPTIRRAGSELWFSFNPYKESDPVYSLFVPKEGPPPPNSFISEVNWRDNPWFPEVLKNERDYLMEVNPELAFHIWEGQCLTISDAQIFKGKFEIREFETPSNLSEVYHGLDFGFSRDPLAATRVFPMDGNLYISNEAYRVGLGIEITADYIKERIPGIEKYVIRGDSARPEMIDYLKRNGLPFIKACKKWKGCVEDGITYMKTFKKIIIHPECENIAKEFSLYSYKQCKLTGDILPEIIEANDHGIDSVRYALEDFMKKGKTGSFGSSSKAFERPPSNRQSFSREAGLRNGVSW